VDPEQRLVEFQDLVRVVGMSEPPQLDEVWVVGNASAPRCLYVSRRMLMIDAFAIFRGETIPERPLEFDPSLGSRPYDLLPSTDVKLVLISARAQEALLPFSGWTTYPVRVWNRSGMALNGYAGLSITGRCGPLLSARPSPYEYSSLYYDPGTWDGSDLFAPEGTSFVFAVPSVANAMRAYRLTNVRLRIASEV
jgi:hypothetical protein